MLTKPISILLLLSSIIFSIPIENWRAPFFQIATEENELRSGPSGMFWDDLNTANLRNPLSLDSTKRSGSYWLLEPAYSQEFSSSEFLTGKRANSHIDLLSEFNYKRFKVVTQLDVDQQYKSDPYFVWQKDRALAGFIEAAYLQFSGKYGFARFGRVKRNWGPFYDRSLLLSNNPYPYDAFEWQFKVPFLEFRHLFAAFPNNYSVIDTKGPILNRFLSVHSLNFILGKWGSLGISESVLFSNNGGFPAFQYVNPFSIYSVINTNGEGNANLMLALEWRLHPATPKIELRGQILLDDFQVDNKTIRDQEPTHWGGDFGLFWMDLLPINLKHHFSLEYRYLSKWIYTVTDSDTKLGQRYTYLGKSLGNPDIDGDITKLTFTIRGKNYWDASAGLSFERKDTNSVETPWQSDVTLGYRKETPLSKRAKLTSTGTFFISADAYFRKYISAKLLFENRWINRRELESDYNYDPRISFSINLHIDKLMLKINR